MRDPKLPTVKRDSAWKRRRRTVLLIAQNRVPRIGKLDADLVLSAGQQTASNQSETFRPRQQNEPHNRRLCTADV